MKNPLNSLDSPSRRQFVERTAKAAFGLSVMPFTDQVMAQNALPEGRKAKHIIYMFMSGLELAVTILMLWLKSWKRLILTAFLQF